MYWLSAQHMFLNPDYRLLNFAMTVFSLNENIMITSNVVISTELIHAKYLESWLSHSA